MKYLHTYSEFLDVHGQNHNNCTVFKVLSNATVCLISALSWEIESQYTVHLQYKKTCFIVQYIFIYTELKTLQNKEWKATWVKEYSMRDLIGLDCESACLIPKWQTCFYQIIFDMIYVVLIDIWYM